MRARHIVACTLVLAAGCYESHVSDPPTVPPRPIDASRPPPPEMDASLPPPPGDRCVTLPAMALAPRVLLADQGFSTTLVHGASADCVCEAATARHPDGVDFQLCNCGDGCDAVLTDYSIGYEEGPLPAGMHELSLGGTPHTLHVVDPDLPFPGAGCRAIEATGVTVITPAGYASSPRLTWVVIEGVQDLCCSPPDGPLFAARSSVGFSRVRAELLTCTQEDCFCGDPMPTTQVAVHSLGEIAPGDYSLRIDGLTTVRFTVPAF